MKGREMLSRRDFNSSDDQSERVYPKSNYGSGSGSGSNNFEYEFSIGLKLILNEISGASLESPSSSPNKINVVLKSINLSSDSVLIPSSPANQYSYCDSNNKQFECFLKSCSLCKKLLTSDKDVYMYRGEGFCSIECRTRKIALDEMKEIEEAVRRRKKTPSCSLEPQLSSSDCPAGGRCETCRLLEDLRASRRRRNPPAPQRRR